MRAGLRHPADVLGRGAAAAADHRGAELDHAAREHVEVLGRRHVEEAAVDGAGQPGVGLHAERQARAEHPLGDGERELRTVAAVHADARRRPSRAAWSATCSGVDPSATVSLGSNAIEAMIGMPGRRAAGRLDRDPDLLEVTEGLEHEQVDAALDERRGLLGERGGHAGRARPGRDAGDEAGRARSSRRPTRPRRPPRARAARPRRCRRAPGRRGRGGRGRSGWRRTCWSR